LHERAFDVVGPEGAATHCVTSPSHYEVFNEVLASSVEQVGTKE
jgi:hypothetical protein